MLHWKSLLNARLPKGVRRKRRDHRNYARRLAAEPLEDRRMLAVMTVTDLSDNTLDNLMGDGELSLREAIEAINTGADVDGMGPTSGVYGTDDEIVFDPSLFAGGAQTISLADVAGARQLEILTSVLITGPGAELLTIDAGMGGDNVFDGDGFRIFDIDDGNNGSESDVTLKGLTLTGGDELADGGAIRSRENLTIQESVITLNASSINGGGVYVRDGSLTISESTISRNEAAIGGGIYKREGGAADLDITNSKITGNDAIGNGGGVFAAFNTVRVNGTTISENYSGSDGGGLYVGGAGFFLTNSTVSGNRAGSNGGGIYGNTVTLMVTQSTVSGNDADSSGGGIWASPSPAESEIVNSTITENTSDDDSSGTGSGGGIYLSGNVYNMPGMSVRNSIIAGNTDNTGTAPDIDNTAAATNPDLNIEFSLIGINDGSGLASGNPDGNNNLIGTSGSPIDPMLDPLGDYGGPTQTHRLIAGSPAIDAGDPAFDATEFDPDLNNDQRGVPFVREFDGDGADGARLDMGAFEFQTFDPSALIVSTDSDVVDDDLSAGNVSLREAVAVANNNPGADTITFDASLSGSTIQLLLGQLEIGEELTIQGLGAENLTVVGGSRVFDHTHPSDPFTIDGMTVTGGSTTGNNTSLLDFTYNGGAIRSLSFGELTLSNSSVTDSYTAGDYANGGAIFTLGNLTITNSTVSGNHTEGDNASGGGIYVNGDGELSITNSTVSGNYTQGNNAPGGGVLSKYNTTITDSTISGNFTQGEDSGGGGIASTVYFGGEPANLAIINSTISGNFTQGENADGGGIFAGVDTTIDNSTIADNQAKYDSATGGGVFASQDLTITNSIVALNTADVSPDLSFDPIDNTVAVRYSIIGDNTDTSLAAAPVDMPDPNGNKIGTSGSLIDPLLGPLQNNGGPTETRALLAGSPAIDMGDPAFDPSAFTPDLDFDQRGTPFVRVFDGDGDGTDQVDIGAFEFDEKQPDRFEINDTIATATNLGSEETVIERELTIHDSDDEDFLKITAHDTGKLIVRIFFDHDVGDLDLEVQDMSGDVILTDDNSDSDNNFEEIIIPVVGQEMYFVRVFGVEGQDDLSTCYDLEIENFPAPVPTGVLLDPADDSGMMNNDQVTNITTPTFFIQTDVFSFVDTNNDGFYSDPDLVGPPENPFDAIHALTAEEAQLLRDGTPQADDTDGGIAVEVTLFNTSDPTQAPIVEFADALIAAFPTVYAYTPSTDLPDGVYLVTARTVVFDGQDPNASGRSGVSTPLMVTIDTVAPEESTFALLASSDSGMFANDHVTNIIQPAFGGFAEPNSKVTVFAQRVDADGNPLDAGVRVGAGTVDTFGEWEVTVEPLVDGKYNFWADFQDLAGNFSDFVSAAALVTNSDGLAIPDNGSATWSTEISQADFTGLVGDSGMDSLILDVNVSIDVTHPDVRELSVFLISPENTEITLVMNRPNDAAAANYTDTRFDDNASTAISAIAAADAPFTATFSPEEPLGNLMGESALGIWELRVEDSTGGNTGTLNSWTLDLQSPLMVVIDTEAPNTPLLALVGDSDNVTANNMPAVTMTSTDPNIAFSELLFQDNLKFRIYDRYENTAEFLLYDSALDTAEDDDNVSNDGFTVNTLIEEMLPEQFFNLFGGAEQDAVIDVDGVGKLADGMHNLKLEVEDRAGNISHDFLLKITVDTSPLLGTWAAGEIVFGSSSNSYADGTYSFASTSALIGTDLDYVFTGAFLNIEDDYYDVLAAYGRVYNGSSYTYRFLIDDNGNGYIDPATEIWNSNANIIGVPVAGNFDDDDTNGDEVGLFTGNTWYLDTNGNFSNFEVTIDTNYTGYPVVGDFNGDGLDDLATFNATSTGGNLFSVDTDRNGTADYSFQIGSSASSGIGFSGTRERPVAADFDGDGVDDIGLWVPDGINPVPNELSEWYLLLSNDDPETMEVEDVLDRIIDGPLNGFVPFVPVQDIYVQLGNTFALPLVGRFAPTELLPEADEDNGNGDNGLILDLDTTDPTLVEQIEQEVQGETETVEVAVEQPEAPVETNEAKPTVEQSAETSNPVTTEAVTTVQQEALEEKEVVETKEIVEEPAEIVTEEPAVETEVTQIANTEENDTPATASSEQVPVEETPVAPVETTKKWTRFRRSRSVRSGASAITTTTQITTTTSTEVKKEVVETKSTPIETVEKTTEPIEEPPVVQQVETTVETTPLEEPFVSDQTEPVETVVIVSPDSSPVEESSEQQEPTDKAVLEAAYALVTEQELADAEPDEELAAEQAEIWEAEVAVEKESKRTFRRSRSLRFNLF